MEKRYVKRPAFSRDDVLAEAINNCLDAMYRASYPSITLDELQAEAKKYEMFAKRHFLGPKKHIPWHFEAELFQT